MADAIQLALAPCNGDPEPLGIVDGVRTWRARSFDPAFTAHAPAPLARGWYRLRAEIDCRSGDVAGPRIYVPDASGAFSERRSIEMRREGHGFVAEVFVEAGTRTLRFDPSRNPCEFRCEHVEASAMAQASQPFPSSPRSKGPRERLHALLAKFRRGPLRTPVPARPPERRERVLAGIDRRGVGLEIGPSHDPIAPKREGFNVHVIDHASREELRRKYASHPVDIDRIEEVDFVWKGETYLALTGRPRHYDWIIASHVIEHTPDLIAFLADCDSVLKDTGVLSLVVPDKRYSFDRFRPMTGLAAVLEANEAGNRKPSAGAIAEAYLNAASKAHQLAWSEGMPGDYYFIHSAHVAREKAQAALEADAYEDVHTWCFVPHSFRLLLHDLFVLGRTPLREVSFHPTEGSEFYVTLGRQGAGAEMSRMELLRAIDAELHPPDSP